MYHNQRDSNVTSSLFKSTKIIVILSSTAKRELWYVSRNFLRIWRYESEFCTNWPTWPSSNIILLPCCSILFRCTSTSLVNFLISLFMVSILSKRLCPRQFPYTKRLPWVSSVLFSACSLRCNLAKFALRKAHARLWYEWRCLSFPCFPNHRLDACTGWRSSMLKQNRQDRIDILIVKDCWRPRSFWAGAHVWGSYKCLLNVITEFSL